MKIYSIIVTIVAVLAIGVAGYFGYQYQNVQNQKRAVEKDMNDAKDELTRTKSSIANIKTSVIALDAVANSFMPTGDNTIGSFVVAKATIAREKIGDITDEKDKEMVLSEWDRFHDSSRLNDFQQLLKKFTENFNRSIDNIQPN